MTINLGEYSSEKALEWAAAWYESGQANRDYVYGPSRVGTPEEKSELRYAEAANKAETAAWYLMLDLSEGEFS